MSKEEIYGYIIERNLYKFNAKNPVDVLELELNRSCSGTEYSKPSKIVLFDKNDQGLFFKIGAHKDFEGWLRVVPDINPEISSKFYELFIYNEKTYLEKRGFLSHKMGLDSDLIRFDQLKNSINQNDPSELFPILPLGILKAHISHLGLSTRATNVFFSKNILKLEDALGISILDMLKWPCFGKKSIEDLCELLINNVRSLAYQLHSVHDYDNLTDNTECDNDIFEDGKLSLINEISLKQHFEKSILLISDNARSVLEYRTGYKEPPKPLEEIGKIIGVTRERVRQIQKKHVEKIINNEYWDDCIAIKIGELLINRNQPLYLEMLEVEDDWFSGFIGNYQHLAEIIRLFSGNEINLLTVNGAVLISRISQEDWDCLLNDFRRSLKNKVNEGGWSKNDINVTFKASLESKCALELLSVVWDLFSDSLQFSAPEEILIAYGKTSESAVITVLQQAEAPLHYSVIADRASDVLGKKVDERTAHNTLSKTGAKLFGRGIYGLEKFNPISDLACNNIRLVVDKMLYDGPLAKQWHVTEILNNLKNKFPSLPFNLDIYLLNIILEYSKKLTYLNKNVWARAD